MDLHDQVPVLILDVLEADISQDTGIVDEDIDSAESTDGSLDDALAVLDRVVVGDGLSARGLDLVDDDVGSLSIVSNGNAPRVKTHLTFEEVPSPLDETPRSLTTTLAPRDPKKVA